MPCYAHSSVSLESERELVISNSDKKKGGPADIFVCAANSIWDYSSLLLLSLPVCVSARRPHLKSLLPHTFSAYDQIPAKVVTQQFSLIIFRLLQYSFIRTKTDF